MRSDSNRGDSRPFSTRARSRLPLRRTLGALAAIVALGAVAYPVPTAQATDFATTSTLDCKPVQVPSVPNERECIGTVSSVIGGGHIGDFMKARPEGADFQFFNIIGSANFATPPVCHPVEVPGNNQLARCAVRFVATSLGNHGVEAVFESETALGAHYTQSKATDNFLEEGFPSIFGVHCGPETVTVTETATCTATVEQATGIPVAPQGVVRFESSERAEFSEGITCPLRATGTKVSACSVKIAPLEVGSGTPKITVTYSGDIGPGGVQTNFLPAKVESNNLLAVHLHGTATALRCVGQPRVGAPTTCTATVSDRTVGSTILPSGSVDFKTNGFGAFSAPNCSLRQSGAGMTCSVSYTPLNRSNDHTVTASFKGDPAHQASEISVHLTVNAGSGAPNTTLTKQPKAKTKSAKARFAFRSSESHSTFKCKLDNGPFKACKSPFAVTVKPGRHTFKVRAVDAGGAVDPTPAVARWTVQPH